MDHLSIDNSVCGLPFISVIIPTFNEGNFIERTLAQLNCQSYPKNLMEVLVVDGGSTDETCQLVADWARRSDLTVKLLSNLKRISSCARNIGIAAAQGEYVLFIDAHVFIPSVELIEKMARSARINNAMVLGRPQPLTPPMLSGFQKIVAGVRGSRLGHSTKSFIYSDFEGWVSPVSVGVMYHCAVFDSAGYFDERFDAAEDVDFNFRLENFCYKAYISPEYKILYYPRRNISGLIRQMYRYGLGRARFARKHTEGFQYELLVPIGVSSLFLLIVTLCFCGNIATILIAFVACGYLLATLILIKSISNFKHLIFAPICLLVIHIGLAAGLLAGLMECLLKGENNGLQG